MNVVQRINSIESRFGQGAPVMQNPRAATGESFLNALQNAQNQNKSSKTASSLNDGISKGAVADIVKETALKYGVNPKLAMAVAQAESNFNQAALSPVGAVGVMQLMPGTASALGVKDINNLQENIDGGVRYLRQMLDTFGGDVTKAVAAYNAGPGAVKSYNGLPPYKETQEYVARVNELAR